MRYPSSDGQDPLLYHRLTGLERADRQHGGRAAVRTLIEQGFVLTPFDDRNEDEQGEMFGIDPIDIVAGDGGAVFLSPFQPVGGNIWTKTSLLRTPGVAFRLSDLLELAEISVRPTDFQSFYNKIIEQDDIGPAYDSMKFQVDHPYNQVFEMEPLSDAFRLIRSAEVYDVKSAINAVGRNRTDAFAKLEPKPRALGQAAGAAAESALRFIEDFPSREFEEQGGDEAFWAQIAGNIRERVAEVVTEAFESWKNPAVSKTAEVLFWGSLPLSRAAILFDGERVVRNNSEGSAFEGLAWPAARR